MPRARREPNVIIFHNDLDEDAHDQFQAWRSDHEDGLFINCKSGDRLLIHRVDCPHLGDTQWTKKASVASLTKLMKVCAVDVRELSRWARENAPGKVRPCHDCKPPDIAADICKAFTREAKQLATSGFFDPNEIADARQRIVASIVRRQGQPKFRNQLLEAYKGRCAISRCNVESVLDAAHILPYKGPRTNHVGNGLLLRTDLHTLFDLGLIAVNTRGMKVLISLALNGSSYDTFAGTRLKLPDHPACHPSREALDQHRDESGL